MSSVACCITAYGLISKGIWTFFLRKNQRSKRKLTAAHLTTTGVIVSRSFWKLRVESLNVSSKPSISRSDSLEKLNENMSVWTVQLEILSACINCDSIYILFQVYKSNSGALLFTLNHTFASLVARSEIWFQPISPPATCRATSSPLQSRWKSNFCTVAL